MTTKTKTKITLGDLSAADRKDLIEQAREASKRNPTDVDGYDALSERERAIRALMDARDHSRGCPVGNGVELGRVEGYDSRVPPNPALGQAAHEVAVIRCVECGGSTVLDGRGGLPKLELEPAIKQAIEANIATEGSVEDLAD
jgi:hypothetical protein